MIIQQHSENMDEKAQNLTELDNPSPKLRFRARLWHYANAEDSTEFNRLLSVASKQRLELQEWDVACVEATALGCHDHYPVFAPIEVDFIHDQYTYDHPRAVHASKALWKIVRDEVASTFAKDFHITFIVYDLIPINICRRIHSRFITVSVCNKLHLLEEIIISPRPPSRLQRIGEVLCRLTVTAAAGALAYGSVSIGGPTGLALVGAAYAVQAYYPRYSLSAASASTDPLLKISHALRCYRAQNASWEQCMRQCGKFSCPNTAIQTLQAAHKLIIAFGEFEESVCHYLPTLKAEWKYSTLGKILLFGGLCILAGGVGGLCFGMLGGKAALGTVVGGGVCSGAGYFERDITAQLCLSKVNLAFKSAKRSVHILYVRTVACFLKETLGIPYDCFTQARALEVLQSCGIDNTILHETGYQEALLERGAAQFRHDHIHLMETVESLFEKTGHATTIKHKSE